MSSRKFCVGAVVRFVCVKEKTAAQARDYKIEQLVEIEDGATLYKIKSTYEPFYRVVSETDLIARY